MVFQAKNVLAMINFNAQMEDAYVKRMYAMLIAIVF